MSEFCWAVKGEVDPRSGAPRLTPAIGEPPYVKELRAQRDALAEALCAISEDADDALALLEEGK